MIAGRFIHDAAFPAWPDRFKKALRSFAENHKVKGPCVDCLKSNGLPFPAHEAPQRSGYAVHLWSVCPKGLRKHLPKPTGNPF